MANRTTEARLLEALERGPMTLQQLTNTRSEYSSMQRAAKRLVDAGRLVVTRQDVRGRNVYALAGDGGGGGEEEVSTVVETFGTWLACPSLLGGYPVHEVLQRFPMMSDSDLRELADDIAQNRQKEPIILAEIGDGGSDQWQIVDGRNRFKACELAGVEPMFIQDHGLMEHTIGPWIISHNLHRRHLTSKQKAAIVAKFVAEDDLEAPVELIPQDEPDTVHCDGNDGFSEGLSHLRGDINLKIDKGLRPTQATALAAMLDKALKRLEASGVDAGSPLGSTENIESAKRLHADGMSVAGIASRFGVSRATASRWIKC